MTQLPITEPKSDNPLTSETSIVTQVKHKINQILVADGPPQEILDYIQFNSGKMLRPILVSLVYQLCQGEDEDELINVATGVELIHIASLVHDDIVDQSALRRGRETLQSRYGPSVSVLAGDFLFAKAFALFTQCKDNNILALMTDVICKMCAGEIEQLIQPGQTEAYYWRYIYNKTACLIGVSCRAGALLGNNTDRQLIFNLERFGHYLGYAFQLVDDILDYTVASEQLGKEAGDDFAQGLWTLPIIRGVNQDLLSQAWSKEYTRQEVTQILVDSGIIAQVSLEVDLYINRALNLLSSFPENPARTQLENIARFVAARNY